MLRCVAGIVLLSCLGGGASASDLLTFRDVAAGDPAFEPALLSGSAIDWLSVYAKPEAQFRFAFGSADADANTLNLALAVTAGLPRFEMPATIRQQH